MADEDVDLSELFPESAHVVLYEREAEQPARIAVRVARAAVAQDGTVQIEGLDGGDYWMCVDGREPIKVTAQGGKVTRVGEGEPGTGGARPAGDGDRLTQIGRQRADTLVHGDPKSYEETLAPAARNIVTGARTSANARIQGARPMAAEQQRQRDAKRERDAERDKGRS